MPFWQKLSDVVLPPSDASPTVAWACNSLKDDPKEWSFDEYHARHEGGAAIWIANGAWALKLVMPGFGKALDDAPNCKPTKQHKALWSAVQTAKRQSEANSLQEYVARSAHHRAKRQRNAEETARRQRWTAEGLRMEADKLERQAAELAPSESEAA